MVLNHFVKRLITEKTLGPPLGCISSTDLDVLNLAKHWSWICLFLAKILGRICAI